MADEIIYAHIILEWRFTPADFFGEPIAATREGYAWSLENGKVEARIDGPRFANGDVKREVIQRELESRFRAAQVLRHQPFELAGPTITKVRLDGTRDIFIELQGNVITVTAGTVSFRATDAEGNVIFDSEQARLQQAREFENRVARHSANALLDFLLDSFQAAVRDPDNELVHLYDLRAALADRFGDRKAKAILGVTNREWSRLGALCNDEPLRQGRHRGAHVGSLRDATEAELLEARTIAKKLLDGYLDVLDKSA